MITQIHFNFFLVVGTLFSQHALGFTLVQTNNNNSKSSSTSLRYANAQALAAESEAPKLESFRKSIAKSFVREEAPVFPGAVLTEQLGREFTTARRYLLAAAAVKELSEDFYAAEEQQRVRAIELIEYARIHNIKLSDYASQIDRSPINKSLETSEFLKELLLQEREDIRMLDEAIAQVSLNKDLVTFLQSIRSDQIDRTDRLLQVLSDASLTSFDPHSIIGSIDLDGVTSATATAATQVSDAEGLASTLVHKMEDMEHLRASFARWYENQLQGLGHQFQLVVSRTGHVTATGATAATAAAVDSVDPESLPSTEEIFDALPVEDILQVVDSATTLLEEPSQLVDALQQTIIDTDALAQIVDVVTGLY